MGLSINTTCNATLDEMLIGTSEVSLFRNWTFHKLGLIVAAGCSFIAIVLSLYLIWMHALHYRKPYEQRHIIRILFMVPVYATASFLGFKFYWHAIYFQVISDCYEAFAIASFFALLCHYIAPNLHEQKAYFRSVQPRAWVLPINWFAKCCGGQNGPWRTPRSGLTWFNIIWTGIYQYCSIRVIMTVTAVVTQYFGKYCESSNSPVFAHIWILVIEGGAVSIAMYCVIQFYVQLRHDLAPHSPFLKVLAIKLVIFLSFWQTFLISILSSSTLGVVKPTPAIAYPDLKVGIPSLLLCVEMAIFAVLHLFAFPWKPYKNGSEVSKYPLSPTDPDQPDLDALGPKQGGFLGIKAFADAMNPWDLVKGFARGMRWLFVGRRRREEDSSYKGSFDVNNPNAGVNLQPTRPTNATYKGTGDLPIANEFRRSKFNMTALPMQTQGEEGAGLIAHAQPNPLNSGSGYVPARQRYDANGQEISSGGTHYSSPDTSPERYASTPKPITVPSPSRTPYSSSPSRVPYPSDPHPGRQIGMAVSSIPDDEYDEDTAYASHRVQDPYAAPRNTSPGQVYLEQKRAERAQRPTVRPTPSEQWESARTHVTRTEDERIGQDGGDPRVHGALWGKGRT